MTQRTESMAGLFVLAAIYTALREAESAHAWRWRAAAIGACAAGMACKESAAIAPILILLYDAAFRGPSVMAALRRRRGFYAGLALTWLVLGGLLISRLNSNSAGFGGGIGPIAYALNQAPLILTYLKLAVVPFPLVLDYGPAIPTAGPSNWATLGIMALLVAGVIASWWRARRLAFLGSWFFVTLAPSSSVVPVFTEVGAERRVYLALAAVVVLAVAGVRLLAQRYARRQAGTAAAVIVCGIATAFAVLTWQRNDVYADPIRLWESVVSARPHCRAHVNLGVLLKDAGRRDQAINENSLARLRSAREPADGTSENDRSRLDHPHAVVAHEGRPRDLNRGVGELQIATSGRGRYGNRHDASDRVPAFYRQAWWGRPNIRAERPIPDRALEHVNVDVGKGRRCIAALGAQRISDSGH